MNISIKKKLFIGVAIILLLMLSVGMIALFKIKAIDNSYSYLINDRAAKLSEAKSLVNTFLDMVVNDRGYLITKKEVYVTQYEQNKKDFKDQYQVLYAKLNTDRGKELLKEVNNSAMKFMDFADKAILLKSQDKNDELTALLDGSSSLVTDTQKVDQAFVEYIEELLNKGCQENNQKVAYTLNTMAVISLCTIVLALLITFYISYILCNPLIKLSNETSKIASGDLSGEIIKVKNNDEIGDLAKFFNIMVTNLREIVNQLKENSNHLAVSAQQLSSNSQQTAAAINESSTATSQLANGVEKVSSSLQEISSISEVTTNLANLGNKEIIKVIKQMAQCNKPETSIEYISWLCG